MCGLTLFSTLKQARIASNSDFLIEREPIVNAYISLPKDKSSLNCASFIAGIVEAFLTVFSYGLLACPTMRCVWGTKMNIQESNFPCKVTAHWHMGTAY